MGVATRLEFRVRTGAILPRRPAEQAAQFVAKPCVRLDGCVAKGRLVLAADSAAGFPWEKQNLKELVLRI